MVGDTGRSFRVELKLPRADDASWWSGRVVLQTSAGRYSFSNEQVRGGARVRVPPSLAYRFEKDAIGDVDQRYWSKVCEPIPVLNADGWTFFRDGIRESALMPNSAPLSWGESYWAVAPKNREPELSDLPGIQLSSVEHWIDSWWVHRFELDDCDGTLSEAAQNAVARLFGRHISARRKRVYLTSPAPHHITDSGDWFIASPCPHLSLLREANAKVSAQSENGEILEVEVIDEERLLILTPSSGAFKVMVDEEHVLTVVIGATVVFSPPGISVRFNDHVCDLIELPLTLESESSLSADTQFKFLLPRQEVASCIRTDSFLIDGADEAFSWPILAGDGVLIDAGGFGWVDTRRSREQLDQPLNEPRLEEIRNSALWLFSVGSPLEEGGLERLVGVDWSKCPSWLQQLRYRAWSPEYAPQVRRLRRVLERQGVA